MKSKTAVFPFDMEACPLLRHSSLLQDYDISSLVSPEGWGFTGEDAGCADQGCDIGMRVESDFDKVLEQNDTILFMDACNDIDREILLYPRMVKAAEGSKNILCTIQLEDWIEEKIRNICRCKGTAFQYWGKKSMQIHRPASEMIYPINVPVVFVLGLAERTNKFEIQLALRENFQKMQYKVSQIGTRHYCELMGFHSFPEFMYHPAVPEHEKVVLFNHYVKNLEIKEEPDIILIGIPGGMMPFNRKFTNKFGILAYEVSQAVLPDAVVLGTLYDTCTPEYFDFLSTSAKYKLGYEVDCYNMGSVGLDWQLSNVEKQLSYIMTDWKFINEKKQQYNHLKTPVYNVLDPKDACDIANFLLGRLEAYSENKIV